MTITLFHPTFLTVGGAEILVATQAQYLRRAGADVRVVTMAFDQARWHSWFDPIPVQVAASAPWTDRFAGPLAKLRRTVPRTDACFNECATVLACNSPTNVLLGASSTRAWKVWCCTEPSRDLHVQGANPTMHERVTRTKSGGTEAERHYLLRLKEHERSLKRGADSALIAYDIEQTRKLDAIYAISEFSRDTVRRVYDRTDAEIIYPMVRFPSHHVAHRPGLDRTGLKVLTHSRLEAPKNVETVLRGFALFAAKQPSAQLHVVGEGGLRGSLTTLAHRLGLASAVRFHGYLSEERLREVYEACDVFALPCIDEPFGMVFPEAAARGLLLVGPDHGGPLEIMGGGEHGWPCDPFSPEHLADALSRIDSLSDAEVDRRREAADRSCRGRFSEEVIGPQLLQALDGRRRAVTRAERRIS